MGRGDVVAFIAKKMPSVVFDMYEIDATILLLDGIQKNRVVYGDFMQQTVAKTYKTIVGNPPYVRTKRGNLYIDFTEKCYQLLDPDGELIFIVPSDFLKLTSAAKLLHTMMSNGTFTHIFHPHNERMFENACIDVIVFRYCKNHAMDKKVLYNDQWMHVINNGGLITFAKEKEKENENEKEKEKEKNHDAVTFSDCFDVYVGLVSGKEEVYKNEELGNIRVLNGKDKLDSYIYIEHYPCDDEKINAHLLQHKQDLLERKIRKFCETNWFEWGAPRNMTAMRNHVGKDCIYVYNLTRKTSVAFVGKVQYFGGGLIMLVPKQNPNGMLLNLHDVAAYMNSSTFKHNFTFSGRFKIGHRQICQSYIPSG